MTLAIPAILSRSFFFWGGIDGEELGVLVLLEERERGRNIAVLFAVYLEVTDAFGERESLFFERGVRYLSPL
jgi:hypothetical protein